MVIPIIIESGNSRALFALLQAAGGLQVVVQLAVGVCNTPYSQAVVHFMHPTKCSLHDYRRLDDPSYQQFRISAPALPINL